MLVLLSKFKRDILMSVLCFKILFYKPAYEYKYHFRYYLKYWIAIRTLCTMFILFIISTLYYYELL